MRSLRLAWTRYRYRRSFIRYRLSEGKMTAAYARLARQHGGIREAWWDAKRLRGDVEWDADKDPYSMIDPEHVRVLTALSETASYFCLGCGRPLQDGDNGGTLGTGGYVDGD